MAPPALRNVHVWFCRSLALTLGIGACLLVLLAVRPGYGAFFVSSTLAFLVAGLLWSLGPPPRRRLRWRAWRPRPALPASFTLARGYRVSAAR
ncbi:MAG TPA: hypothetical protein VII06_29125 [Chloroflexota bacterium]|jgi:hypothetical protein